MTTKEIAIREEAGQGFDLEEVHRLDSRIIPQIREDMENARKLIFSVLEKDVDYGHQPGTQGMALWDSGASMIIRAFHCHAEHKVIFHEESDDLITWTIEANIIHNASKEIIGQGVGSASTRETKYKYRWVKKIEALALGYSEEDIAELKTRDSKSDPGITEYRVINPEYGDLANTLLAMSSKRAEVDAAKSLPGVGGALKILFDPELSKKKGVQAIREAVKEESEKPEYKRFWSMVKGMGVSEDSVHRALGVEHMEDWLNAGHTLDDAIILIGRKLVELSIRSKKPPENPETTTKVAQDIQTESAPVRPELIKTVDDLVNYARHFWGMDEAEMWKRLRYKDRDNFKYAAVQTPFEAYQELLLQRQAQKN